MTTESLNQVLDERGSSYGLFHSLAHITQELKTVMHDSPNWKNARLSPAMMESLEMIQHKIGRILNGDPFYDDSWIDIAGYATLISDSLNGNHR